MINFFFNIKGDPNWNAGTIFFYNGDLNIIQPVHNTEELKWLQAVYENSNEKRLPCYYWVNMAPVYIRIFGVVQPGTTGINSSEIQKRLDLIKRYTRDYIDIYGDPTHIRTSMRIPIRSDCTKTAEVLGWTDINQMIEMDKTVTVCDYHWGRIDYNGKKAWIAIGDITGETYGELFKRY